MNDSNFVFFWGGVFSNFHPITGDNDTSEHIFMAQKAIFFRDFETLAKIVVAPRPLDAKKLGRTIVGFDEEKWKTVREEAMMLALTMKAERCPEFRQALIDSGEKILVEASPRDSIWGIGFAEKDAVLNKDKWGLNLLGECLMAVRCAL